MTADGIFHWVGARGPPEKKSTGVRTLGPPRLCNVIVGVVAHMHSGSDRGPSRGELDEATIDRAKHGDGRACTDFVRHYERAVFAVLGRMLRPRGLGGDVEDLAQEVFFRAFVALPRFELDGRARLSTWLLCIASRLAINEINRKRPPVEVLSAEVAVPGPQSGVDARQALARAISLVTPEQQAVLVLREFHGLDDAAIGEVLGVKPGAVKARVARARARLRELMGKEVFDA